MTDLHESRTWDLPSAQTIDLAAIEPQPHAINLVPESIARECAVFPLQFDAGSLILAVPPTSEGDMLDTLCFMFNCEITPVVAAQSAIAEAIKRWYT